ITIISCAAAEPCAPGGPALLEARRRGGRLAKDLVVGERELWRQPIACLCRKTGRADIPAAATAPRAGGQAGDQVEEVVAELKRARGGAGRVLAGELRERVREVAAGEAEQIGKA